MNSFQFGPLLLMITAAALILWGRSKRNLKEATQTTFTGSDIEPEEQKAESEVDKDSKKGLKSWAAKAFEFAKKRWEDGWVLFLIAFGMLHAAAWLYFPKQYAFVMTLDGVIPLLAVLIFRSLIKDVLKKHKGVSSGFSLTILALLIAIGRDGWTKWEQGKTAAKIEAYIEEQKRVAADPESEFRSGKRGWYTFATPRSGSRIFYKPRPGIPYCFFPRDGKITHKVKYWTWDGDTTRITREAQDSVTWKIPDDAKAMQFFAVKDSFDMLVMINRKCPRT